MLKGDGNMSELEPSVEALEGDTGELIEEPQNGEQGTIETVKSQLEQLLTAVGTLQEQFNDKIEVDAHKNALFDKMHEELVRYRNGILDRLVEAMALDIIQLVDFTKHFLRVYEEEEVSEDSYKRLLGIVSGIAKQLNDILYRQSIEPYRTTGEEVNVRRQKILQTVATDEQAKNNLVAERVADGYEKDGKVIRPEQIKIYKYYPQENENPKINHIGKEK